MPKKNIPPPSDKSKVPLGLPLQHTDEDLDRLSQIIQEEFKDLMGGRLEHFAEWVLDDDPQVVHRLLHALCEKILVYPDHRLDFLWRAP